MYDLITPKKKLNEKTFFREKEVSMRSKTSAYKCYWNIIKAILQKYILTGEMKSQRGKILYECESFR